MHFSWSFTLRSSWAQLELNADFRVSLPGNVAGLHDGAVSDLDRGCFFKIPVVWEWGLLATFLWVEMFAVKTECGWNLTYSLSRSYEINLLS